MIKANMSKRYSAMLKAICISLNGESGNGMRGMIGMQGIRVEVQGIMELMGRIRVGIQGIAVGKTKVRVREYFCNGLFTKSDL